MYMGYNVALLLVSFVDVDYAFTISFIFGGLAYTVDSFL